MVQLQTENPDGVSNHHKKLNPEQSVSKSNIFTKNSLP